MSSARTEVLTIEHTLLTARLDTFLRDRFPAVSRGAIQRLIDEGHIRVNGRTVKPTHTPRAGEQVEVCWPEAGPAKAQPEEMPLDILHEDESLLVLNKPPGLVVHPAAGHQEHTLVNALLHHCAGELSGIGGQAIEGLASPKARADDHVRVEDHFHAACLRLRTAATASQTWVSSSAVWAGSSRPDKIKARAFAGVNGTRLRNTTRPLM